MTKHDDGGPAYPNFSHDCNDCPELAKGMTLLDYFAGQALAGYRGGAVAATMGSESMTKLAYFDADAMIAEKKRREAESD